jgi:hypothetical protein
MRDRFATPAKAKPSLGSIAQFPQWFGAVFAFVYICGYLIDFFHYSAKGIVDVGGDLLKLRYIHIGISFGILLAITVGPLFYVFFGRSRLNQQSVSGTPFLQINNWLIGAAIFYWWSVFVPTVFASPLYFNRKEHIYRYVALFIVALTFVAYTTSMRWIKRDDPKFEWKRSLVGKLIIALILAMDRIVFPGMWPTVRAMFPGILFFFGFSVGIAGLIDRVYEIMSGATEWNLRAVVYAFLSSCTLFLLLFVDILAYAYVVFPFIPSVKGGADYTEAHRVHVITAEDAVEKGRSLRDVILLYSTSTSFFFAEPVPGNDACDWRRPSVFPNFVQVRREQVHSLALRPNTKNCF